MPRTSAAAVLVAGVLAGGVSNLRAAPPAWSLAARSEIRSSDGTFWRDHGGPVLTVAAAATVVTVIVFVAIVSQIRRSARREIEVSVATARGEVPRDSMLAVEALASLAGHVAVLDRHGTILATNEAWTAFGEANGVRNLAAIGRGVNYLEVCARGVEAGASGAAAARDGVDAVCSGGSPEFEAEYRSDGPLESAWFQMKVTPLRDLEGGAVVSHRDITALKRQEIAARERDLSMLVDALPVAVKIVDAAGVCRHFNTTWLRMTGRSLDDELGRHWMERVHPDDRAECERAYQEAVAKRTPLALEYRLHSQAGEYLWLLDRLVPRYDADGAFSGVVSASVDITERRQNEKRLRDVTGRLVTAQEDERSRIGHELHDDINQRLALLAIGVEQAEAHLADSAAAHATFRDLWQQTIETSRAVHALSHELHSSALDALGLVGAIGKLARELSEKRLHVTLTADEGSNDLSREARLGLFRVVQEALSNVLRHSGEKDAFVTLRADDREVIVRVEDFGCGFDQRADSAGLGLISMTERLTSLGGQVQVRSRPGSGTTVEARAPRTRAAPARDAGAA